MNKPDLLGPDTDYDNPRPEKRVPTLDDSDTERPPEVDYRDWSPETSKVVSGPAGPAAQFPGRRFRNKREAKAHWLARAGRILEDLSMGQRYMFRVRKDA